MAVWGCLGLVRAVSGCWGSALRADGFWGITLSGLRVSRSIGIGGTVGASGSPGDSWKAHGGTPPQNGCNQRLPTWSPIYKYPPKKQRGNHRYPTYNPTFNPLYLFTLNPKP